MDPTRIKYDQSVEHIGDLISQSEFSPVKKATRKYLLWIGISHIESVSLPVLKQ